MSATSRKKRPRIAVLVLEAVRRHGPVTDEKLCAILRAHHGLKDSSVRGRRAELVRAGELEQVGRTADGRGLFDIRGLRRRPAMPPEQRNLFD